VATVAAAESRVALIDVKAADDAGPESVAAVEEALAASLRLSGHEVITPEALAARLEGRDDLRGCTRADCLDRAAGLLGATRLVGAAIRRAGSSVGIDVWVYDPAARASVVGKRSCTRCGVAQVGELASAALDEALGKDARRFVPATVQVSSHPSGATVRLDGRASGLTPLRLRVPAGSHGLSVSKGGFVTQARDFDAEGGEALELHFALVPAARSTLWPGYKWISLGGALVALGLGGTLLAIDGNDLGSTPGPVERREIRDTRAGGMVFVGLGAALGVTGAALWWVE